MKALTTPFPNAKATVLDAFYDLKGKLHVKMAGVGKNDYKLITTERGTSRARVNPKLSEEIKKALGHSAQEIHEERLERLETVVCGNKEGWKMKMEVIRTQINRKHEEIEKLEARDADEGEMNKVKKEIADLEEKHKEYRDHYERAAQTERENIQDVDEEIQEWLQETEALEEGDPDDDPARKALGAFKKRGEAIDWRRDIENKAISKPDSTPQRV